MHTDVYPDTLPQDEDANTLTEDEDEDMSTMTEDEGTRVSDGYRQGRQDFAGIDQHSITAKLKCCSCPRLVAYFL